MTDRKGEKRITGGYTAENIEWRRDKIMSYLAHGFTNQAEIARIMQVPMSTVSKDVRFLKNQARENLANFTEQFAWEYEKCVAEINAVQKEAWLLSQSAKYERNKLLGLALVKDCLIYKTELITNSSVVMRASNFIELRKKKLHDMVEQEGLDDRVENEDYNGKIRYLPAPTESERSEDDVQTEAAAQ